MGCLADIGVFGAAGTASQHPEWWKGKPMEMTSVQPPWLEALGKQMASMIGQGLQTGATPMPPEFQQAWREAYSVPQSANWAMNIMPQMFGGGQQFPMMQPGGQFNMPFFGQGGGFAGAGVGGQNMPMPMNFGMPGGGFNFPPGFDPFQARPA